MDKARFNKLLSEYKSSQRAFDELYTYYFHRIVYHVSWKFSREIAEDVAQEFFLKLMRIELDEPVENPTSWVYTVADNLARSFLKKYKSYDELTGDEFYEFISDFDERETIKKCLAELTSAERKIVVMYYFEGYSLKEIAGIIGENYDAVKKRHARTLKKLQKIFKKVSP